MWSAAAWSARGVTVQLARTKATRTRRPTASGRCCRREQRISDACLVPMLPPRRFPAERAGANPPPSVHGLESETVSAEHEKMECTVAREADMYKHVKASGTAGLERHDL